MVPPMNAPDKKTASFGYRDVPEDEKSRLVRGVFSSVASRYDLMNDLMSGGAHRLWKRFVIDLAGVRAGEKVLDVAGGTGDIAFRMMDRMGSGASPVTICDINAEMLAVGRERAQAAQRQQAAPRKGAARPDITFIEANAEALPLPDKSFDAVTIAFGIRNVASLDAGLAEVYRVLQPGARFVILEFSTPRAPLVRRAYLFYFHRVLPVIGGLISGHRTAYKYLPDSVAHFPETDELARRMTAAGFTAVSYAPQTFGIAAIHHGWAI